MLDSVADADRLPAVLVEAMGVLSPGTHPCLMIHTRSPSGNEVWRYPEPIDDPWILEFSPFISTLENGQSGCHRLFEIAPSGFDESAFYQAVYLGEGFVDGIGHGTQLGDSSILVGCVSRTPFTDDDVTLHREVYPVISACSSHLASLVAAGGRAAPERTFGTIDGALTRFGSGLLTEREQQVIHLILRGHNTESITQQLAISQNTIKRHRSHAYKKLKVGSHGELFVEFLRSIGMRLER